MTLSATTGNTTTTTDQQGDGDEHNMSWNCGAEGPSEDEEVLQVRARQMRNFVATLMFSQGVPMLRSGDEICHSQDGNNNTYCQDNELSWLNWQTTASQREFQEFVCSAIKLRHRLPVLRRRRFFQGRQVRSAEKSDIVWFTESGKEMQESDWNGGRSGTFGVRLSGKMLDEVDEQGNPIVGNTIIILFNASPGAVEFVLPNLARNEWWKPILHSCSSLSSERRLGGGATLKLVGHSIVALELNQRWTRLRKLVRGT